MKIQTIIAWYSFVIAMMVVVPMNACSSSIRVTKDNALTAEHVLKTLEHVTDWQINQPDVISPDFSWVYGILYIGLMDLSNISENKKYHQWLHDFKFLH